ncbi:hypothetical protein TNCV_4968431 [Trichonephila clavipes]|nr:hypothetical protein TNCV_4968431 [Trichonephila clavipes]
MRQLPTRTIQTQLVEMTASSKDGFATSTPLGVANNNLNKLEVARTLEKFARPYFKSTELNSGAQQPKRPKSYCTYLSSSDFRRWGACADVSIQWSVTSILTSRCSATRGLLATDHVILNHGQVTWTTPELAPPSPNYHTTPTGGRFSSRQI